MTLRLAAILAVATLGYLLAACALGPPRIVHETVTRCDGATVRTWVRIEESYAPTIRCAELWSQAGYSAPAVALGMAALPIGCAVRRGENSDGELWQIVVPPGNRDGGLLLEHELHHTRGWIHPLPWLSIGHVCKHDARPEEDAIQTKGRAQPAQNARRAAAHDGRP